MQRADDVRQRHLPPSSSAPQRHLVSQQQPKALRFVTNYGAPHPKRRRIGAACLTCRKRKTACSGERPFCDTCKQNKLDCAGYSSETTVTSTPKSFSPDSRSRSRKIVEQNGGHSLERARESPTQSEADQKNNPSRLSQTISSGYSPNTPVEPAGQFVEDSADENAARESLFSGPRNRMPYFRWLGPTAIMPGFKQMVVKVKRHETDVSRSSTDGGAIRSPSTSNPQTSEPRGPSIYANTPAALDADSRTTVTLPFYDTSAMPPSELITHLANTFFTHLGCNYPFLQRERFLRDLEEKQVDAILVDAVCALAARFSTHSLLTQLTSDGENKTSPAEYGHAFAQRARVALTDVFPCPTVAAAQAALLLAYNEFGEQRDSGLWMYLGIAIRLAQDLGLHTLEGLRYIGMEGPTPKAVKRQSKNDEWSRTSEVMANVPATKGKPQEDPTPKEQSPEDQQTAEETRAVEQERVDTFWAIFFLDRVVSSGTGRRSTLRDKDIELSFPPLSQTNKSSNWTAPFPALIRIVHLYGRVADLLNSIKEPSDITTETSKRLAAMEHQVTNFYQNLSPRLHFDAVNFQHYMKAGEGTNFVLLHFWFHTLIILLHQPTLLKTFEGRMLQLFPNSQQLAMSSAKTIADILSYSQLMDAKASLGNPFTSQPIYIAGCAFLRETVEQTATSNQQSRAPSPTRSKDNAEEATTPNGTTPQSSREASLSQIMVNDSPLTKAATSNRRPHLAKHTLLATAASQHYQLCYKALQSLETYWAGAKYILTIMDQKFEGIGDPLLYTVEEAESSMEEPRPEPAFTSPGWRRKLSWGRSGPNFASDQSQSWPPKGFGGMPGSPRGVDPGKAIGWTLTGTMDSSETNLAWHFPGQSAGGAPNSNLDPRLSPLNPSEYDAASGHMQNIQYPRHLRGESTSSQRLALKDKLGRPAMQNFTSGGAAPANGDGESLLSLGATFPQHGATQAPGNSLAGVYTGGLHAPMLASQMDSAGVGDHHMGHHVYSSTTSPAFFGAAGPFGNLTQDFIPEDMMIESRNVDMSMLGLDMPWFDSYPASHEMIALFDPPHAPTTAGGSVGGADSASGNRHDASQQR